MPIYLPAWAIDVIHEITGQSWSVIVQADVVDGDLSRRVVAWQETSEGHVSQGVRVPYQRARHERGRPGSLNSKRLHRQIAAP